MAVTWQTILRVLPDERARSLALAKYKAAGFKPDDLERKPRAREAMADALTRVEDWLETVLPRRVEEREAIRVVRRRLERA